MSQKIVALLGRKDEPTDAVEEYCRYLGDALKAHGFESKIIRVSWVEKGWPAALRELHEQAKAWRGQWVFVQYTALAWSARGFPLRFLRVLKILRRAGVRIGVVYHDVEPYTGSRFIDKLRRAAQLRAMRRGLRLADLGIFTVPLDMISWLGNLPEKATFIPVGANLPVVSFEPEKRHAQEKGPLRIAVFGITGGEAGRNESAQIVEAVRFAAAKMGKLRLYAFGRHADDCATQLREGLRDMPVEVCVDGVLPSERVIEELSSSDVLLFVRGVISTRRGSAIAGIACGLPVIAYQGPETAAPITEAGVVLVSPGNRDELGNALLRVLMDRPFRESLATKSRVAQEKYFSWPAIASRYAEEIRKRG
jgi:glycosyltransferase involved in cell wall biosynthesis